MAVVVERAREMFHVEHFARFGAKQRPLRREKSERAASDVVGCAAPFMDCRTSVECAAEKARAVGCVVAVPLFAVHVIYLGEQLEGLVRWQWW